MIRAANGREALDTLRAPDAAIDIVLTDVRMPVMDGTELYQCAQEELGQMVPRFVFLTGWPGLDAADFLQERPSLEVIQKPVSRAELLEAIAGVLAA